MPWAPDYVTTSELKTYVRVDDTLDDTVIDLAIAAASRAVDRHTGRQFGVVAAVEERLYTAQLDRRRQRYRPRWVVDVDDLMSTAGLVVEADGVTVTTYTLQPVNAAKVGRPWTELTIDTRSAVQPLGDPDEIAVTALWGWTAVPDAVKAATSLQASRLFSRRSSPYGVAGSPELGSEMRLLAKVDVDVEVMLADYVRHWGSV